MPTKSFISQQNLAICLTIIAIVPIYFHSFNLPYAPDDAYIMLDQFRELLESRKSIGEFLFGITLYPHPKLTSRLLSLSSIVLFGEINFKFLQVIGNLSLFVLIYSMWRHSTKSILIFFVMLGIGAIPIQNTFWSISITSLPFYYLFSFYTYKFYRSKKLTLLILAGLLTIYTSGQGFISLLLLGLISSIDSLKNRNLRKNIYSQISILLLLILWYLTIYLDKPPSTEAVNSSSIELVERVYYFAKFPISIISNIFISLDYKDWVISCFGLSAITHYVYLVKKSRFSTVDFLALIVLFMGIIAVLTRLNTFGYHPSINPRYEIHSLIFLICYATKIKMCSRKIRILLFTLIFPLTIIKLASNYNLYMLAKPRKVNMLRNHLIDRTNGYSERKKYNSIKKISKYGYYNLPNAVFSEQTPFISKLVGTSDFNPKYLNLHKKEDYFYITWNDHNEKNTFLICKTDNEALFKIEKFKHSKNKSCSLISKSSINTFKSCDLLIERNQKYINRASILIEM